MRVLVIVKANKDSEAGILDTKEFEEMGKFNDELIKAGVMLAGEGLKPSSKGARVKFTGKNTSVIDGPFAETRELVAGFWIWRVKSLEDAVNWLKRAPFQDTTVEIRPIYEMEDFGDALTPELREGEERQRAEVEKLASDQRKAS